LVALGWHFQAFYLPLLAIILIGVISFLDDLYTLSSKLRIVFHMLAVSMVFSFFKVFSFLPVWEVLVFYILAIGIINAYNFMDGINGITGLYTLVILVGLQWINTQQTYFIQPDMIWLPLLASVVFLFFNFRTKAKCFAGDIGSVTIALWVIMLLLNLIFITHSWVYILFLAVYGVDSILTIIHRLILKQNIFKAHRLHFYQLLANEHKIPHLLVATGYALVQLVIILLVIFCHKLSPLLLFIITLIPLLFIYLVFKPRLMK
jgi:UDP-N-acetylmuramyl pentapeptide phosphotransferase/UDP-N-acetylglucosamine-1-phosphate transferase